MARPLILVLAGVNGAGKSSVAGHLLTQADIPWFNPDAFAKAMVDRGLASDANANGLAWAEGMRRLDQAVANGHHFAFETTLGGNTVPRKLSDAAGSHDLAVWFVGLDTVERHLARVNARVRRGGHPIPREKIDERFVNSVLNLIGLLPDITHLKVFDNSAEAGRNGRIPDPQLVLEMVRGRIRFPGTKSDLLKTPDWAKPILEAALRIR